MATVDIIVSTLVILMLICILRVVLVVYVYGDVYPEKTQPTVIPQLNIDSMVDAVLNSLPQKNSTPVIIEEHKPQFEPMW